MRHRFEDYEPTAHAPLPRQLFDLSRLPCRDMDRFTHDELFVLTCQCVLEADGNQLLTLALMLGGSRAEYEAIVKQLGEKLVKDMKPRTRISLMRRAAEFVLRLVFA